MSKLDPSRTSALLNAIWRTVFRLGSRLLAYGGDCAASGMKGRYWRLYVDGALLVVRSSYRREWNFPGGSVRSGETPDGAARRELAEEIGLVADHLTPAGYICGFWDGRRECVHFFELRLDRLPDLLLDNREIIAAQLFLPSDLHGMALTGPVASYLRR